MPVIGEDVTVTEDDVAVAVNAARRRDNLKRIDVFINTASTEEVTHIKKSLAYRSMALGISPTSPKPKTADRIFARLAVESVPILLTLLVFTPLVIVGVLILLYETTLIVFTQGCPPTCDTEALILWAMVVAIGLMIIILAYHSIRKLMIRVRE